MNAQPLYLKDGRESGCWLCGTCRSVYSDRHGGREHADSCCKCRICGTSCPRDSKGNWTNMHQDCWHQRQRETYQKKLADAELVETYDGFVFVDGYGPQDGYFPSAEEAEEYLYDQCEPEDRPGFAFCCTPEEPPKLDVEDVTQRFYDNGYDGICDDLTGVKELQAALDAFWEQNRRLVSWSVDYSRKVRLSYPEGEA